MATFHWSESRLLTAFATVAQNGWTAREAEPLARAVAIEAGADSALALYFVQAEEWSDMSMGQIAPYTGKAQRWDIRYVYGQADATGERPYDAKLGIVRLASAQPVSPLAISLPEHER